MFFITVLIQAFFYVFFFSRFAFSKSKKYIVNKLPVSVIICAYNEAENLTNYLPFIIEQEYPNFQIVLINDHSSDDTLKIMQHFQSKHKNIHIVHLDQNVSGNKKNAVTQGIKAAKYEHLLFTDADCKPASKHWISEMASHFSEQKEIVLGYGAYEKEKSWLNKLIRFETLLTAIQYFSYAKNNLAYMGVGRNLAYKKSLFKISNGFKTHQHIQSGDDDLFVNQVAKKNVSCCFSKESFTYSKPHTNFKKWIYQKRRHISTANHYKPIHQFLLGMFYISQFAFWFLGLFLLFTSSNLILISALFGFRLVFQYLIYGFSAKKLQESDLFIYLPFLELILISIQLRIFIQNLFQKPKNWKIN